MIHGVGRDAAHVVSVIDKRSAKRNLVRAAVRTAGGESVAEASGR
jgi:hypothetical protein